MEYEITKDLHVAEPQGKLTMISMRVPQTMKDQIRKTGLSYRAVLNHGLMYFEESHSFQDEVSELQRQITNFYKQISAITARINDVSLRVKDIECLPVILEAQREIDRKIEGDDGTS